MADARHILVVDEWPEDYSDPELVIVADKIMQEWEGLRGENLFYSRQLNLLMQINKDRLRADALLLVSKAIRINSILFDGELAYFINKILSDFKFQNLKSYEEIINKHNQIVNKINNRLGQIQNNKSGSESEYLKFEDLIAEVEDKLPNVKCDFDITVAKYEAFKRRIKLREN